MTPPARCPRDSSCPSTVHDTYSAHRGGCTSPAALAAKNRYQKLRRCGIRPYRRLPHGPYVRRLQALAARGHTAVTIAARTGLHVTYVRRIMRGDDGRHELTQRTARLIDRVFRELADQPGTDLRVKRWAEEKGWVPAACWDDIDNMDEKPKLGTRRDRSIPAQHRGEVLDRRTRVARLQGEGKSLHEISVAVGITPRSVSRHLAAIAAGDTGEAVAA